MPKPIQAEPANEDNALYVKHKKVYPREVHGIFANFRIAGVLGLLGLYYIAPWLQWAQHQAVLFDLPARKFFIFGLTFWPRDFFYLALLLIIAALSLFFFTALAGRLWCGYACPQTVWTEVFLWIERKIEGDRNKQIKLDKSPLTRQKFTRKATKQVIWILFSAWTGFTFVGYFTPILELGHNLLQFNLGPWESFWIIFYGFATYGNAGFMREQVCIYMCPYARFQSAMFDKDTLIISYDEQRGEPRGSRQRNVDPAEAGLGDCVNCQLCVQACPTGIDIRDGLQYQCIGCAACIDACNDVMAKMGYANNLIKYTTQNAIDGGTTRILRPRILIYILLLAVITGGFLYSIVTRTPLELDIIRDRNTLFNRTEQGWLENSYVLKIINKDAQTHNYRLRVTGIQDMKLIAPAGNISIASGKTISLPIRIQVDPVHITSISHPITVHVDGVDSTDIKVSETAVFIGKGIQ